MAQPHKTKALNKKCQMAVFGVQKDLSFSYREGIYEKLKSMAQPYNTKVLKTMPMFLTLLYFFHNSPFLQSKSDEN